MGSKMVNLFVSYRGLDRSRVREIEKDLRKNGLCHNFVDDLDEGDLRVLGSSKVWLSK